jgi:hypothetical protein
MRGLVFRLSMFAWVFAIRDQLTGAPTFPLGFVERVAAELGLGI